LNIKHVVSVTVHPAPEITWYHNGLKIKTTVDDESRYVTTRETGLYTLEIKSCQADDNGEVSVVAKNCYGEDQCKATLSVQRE